MGTRDRRLGRAVPRTLPLVIVAMVVALVGATGAGAAPKTPPGDPPGNNGTVKIERDGPMSAGRNNEPHVDGCIFWLEYYGFDQGETADITFTAQAPSTPKDTVLIADKGVLVSDTPAGGGKDKDFVIAYNLTSAVQGLKAHPRHGYHIKLSSDSVGAPGGAKQKVFWIKCAPANPTTLRVSKAVQGTSTATGFAFTLSCNHRPLDRTFTLDPGGHVDVTDVPAGTTCAVTETDRKGADAVTASETPPDAVPNDGVVKVATTPVVVVFTNVFPGTGGTPAPDNSDLQPPPVSQAGETGGTGTPAGGQDAIVLGETVTRPESLPEAAVTLPRTGGDPGLLAATGLWALVAGGLALVAGRRRA